MIITDHEWLGDEIPTERSELKIRREKTGIRISGQEDLGDGREGTANALPVGLSRRH
jgi:hypothetical protein